MKGLRTIPFLIFFVSLSGCFSSTQGNPDASNAAAVDSQPKEETLSGEYKAPQLPSGLSPLAAFRDVYLTEDQSDVQKAYQWCRSDKCEKEFRDGPVSRLEFTFNKGRLVAIHLGLRNNFVQEYVSAIKQKYGELDQDLNKPGEGAQCNRRGRVDDKFKISFLECNFTSDVWGYSVNFIDRAYEAESAAAAEAVRSKAAQDELQKTKDQVKGAL
jgi:hypothetical protein